MDATATNYTYPYPDADVMPFDPHPPRDLEA